MHKPDPLDIIELREFKYYLHLRVVFCFMMFLPENPYPTVVWYETEPGIFL